MWISLATNLVYVIRSLLLRSFYMVFFMHWFAFNLPLVQEKWCCQPSSASRIIVTKQSTHRFGASHLSDCRWISMHEVHSIFHGQLRICFKDLRFSRLYDKSKQTVKRLWKMPYIVWIIFFLVMFQLIPYDVVYVLACVSKRADEWIYNQIAWIYLAHYNCPFFQQCLPCQPSYGR